MVRWPGAGGGAGVKTIAASSGRAGAAPRSMSERRHVRHVQDWTRLIQVTSHSEYVITTRIKDRGAWNTGVGSWNEEYGL